MGVTFISDQELEMLAAIGGYSSTDVDVIWGCDQAAGVTHTLDQLALAVEDEELRAQVLEKRDVAAEAEISPVPTAKVFRHTYATARLQTTDGGKQISLWTVAKELGHKTVARVEDTYGHPSHFRPRGEVVEYRV